MVIYYKAENVVNSTTKYIPVVTFEEESRSMLTCNSKMDAYIYFTSRRFSVQGAGNGLRERAEEEDLEEFTSNLRTQLEIFVNR